MSVEMNQKRSDADGRIARAVKEPRDFDKITHLLALVEAESKAHGESPSRDQWAFVYEIREKVRDALLAMMPTRAEDRA